jgi:hypothetical protein
VFSAVTSQLRDFPQNAHSWIRTAANLTATNQDLSNDNLSVPLWWKSFCERQPHYELASAPCEPNTRPSETVVQWLTIFLRAHLDPAMPYPLQRLEELLFASISLTTQAFLHEGIRPVKSSGGLSVLKPEITLTSIIVITVLLIIQVIGLIFCGIYIARAPTWTRVFNAMAIARIGAGLEKGMLPVDGQYAEDEDYEKLRGVKVPLDMASGTTIRHRSK